MYDYDYAYGARRRRRWPAVIGIGVTVMLLVVASYLLGSHSSGRSGADPAVAPAPAPAPTVATSAPQSALPAGQPSDDPVMSATAWLQAYRSLSYVDSGPTAWIDRVRPVVTDRLAGEYDSYREGSAGADWEDFVAQRCTATLEKASGVIPDEAPRTKTAANVQLSGTLQTRCQTQNGAERPPENLAATVVVVKAADGLWRVDRRLY